MIEALPVMLLGSGLFAGFAMMAFVSARGRLRYWDLGFGAVMGWAGLHVVLGFWIAGISQMFTGLYSLAGSVLTAAVAFAATRSFVVPIACAVAVAVEWGMRRTVGVEPLYILLLLWNALLGLGWGCWAWRVSRLPPLASGCVRCGRDVEGLAATRCPKCAERPGRVGS